MIEATCDCGAVRLQIASPPESVLDCNCSICHRYGALWAYYTLDQVRITGATTSYLRGKKSTEFHHCAVCRCLSHWRAVEKSVNRMGVNARLLPPDILHAARRPFRRRKNVGDYFCFGCHNSILVPSGSMIQAKFPLGSLSSRLRIFTPLRFSMAA